MNNQLAASESMLKRIRLLALYIQLYHKAEFREFWEKNWRGNANAEETLSFFTQPELEKVLILMQRIDLGKRPRD